MFRKKVRILIIGDYGAVLDRLKQRIALFWPPEIPVKTVAMYCGWAEEAVGAIKEFQPDIILLNYKFRHDEERTGRDVALWIDRNYGKPVRVAAHADRSEEDLRQLFSGAKCVKYFLCGERLKEFIEDWTREEKTAGG